MEILVVQVAVEDYGSTHDEDIVVPWTMVTDLHPLSPSKKKKTKTWMLACLIGLTAVTVVSSVLLFVSRMDSSSVLQTTCTKEAFLLHSKDGTCVAQSGAWTPGTTSVDDDDDANSPYATCFINVWSLKNDLCWSRSYINKDGD